MVETGNYVDIRLQDVPRYKKPAGIYWLQSAAVLLSGDGANAPIWVYRTVSVLGATLAVLVAAWLGARMFGPAGGMVSGFVLAGIVMLAFEARIAKTDATLLATGMFAQAALARLYLGDREGRPRSGTAPWVFWAAQGAAIMVKGPVIPLLSALTVAAIALFDKDRRWLRQLKPLRGILLTILICAPWLALITWKSGAAFWQESVGKDLLSKVGGGQESHGAPPGYYTLIFVFFFWPFAVAAIEGGLRALNRFRRDPRLLFCLAWYLPYWIVVELIPTKLPHYMLPAYPAAALLIAWLATDAEARAAPLKRWQIWLRRLTIAGFVLVTVALAAASIGVTPYLMKHVSWWGIVAAVFALLAGWFGSGIRPVAAPLPRILAATICSAALFAILTIVVLPPLKPVWLSPQIAAAFKAAKSCPDSRLIAVGYQEPSLVFLAGTDTLLTGPKDAAAALTADKCAVAVVDDRNIQAFTSALPGGQASVEEVGTVRGVNYSKGTERLLILFRDKK